MKRSLATLCLLLALSLATFAGEVETPGIVNPTPTPTPCEDCSTTTSAATGTETDTAELDLVTLLWVLFGLPRP